jgi:hypothetical protein
MDAGTYFAVLTSHCLALSKNSQTPSVRLYLQIKFNVESPDIQENKRMYADLWLSEKCIERTMHTLTKTFGWTGEDIEELNNNPTMLEGGTCLVVIEMEEYNGNLIPKIKYVNEVHRKLDSGKAKWISQNLSDKIKAYKAKSPKVEGGAAIPGADIDEPLPKGSTNTNADDELGLPF